MNLSQDSIALVREAMTRELSRYDSRELTGISCLARGADTVFAQAVIDLGGSLEVIVPSENYRSQKVKPADSGSYDSLLGHASAVHTLPYSEANREAYAAANDLLLSGSDLLIAVWDGRTGVDQGSTASVVTQAQHVQRPVTVIWPEGAQRV